MAANRGTRWGFIGFEDDFPEYFYQSGSDSEENQSSDGDLVEDEDTTAGSDSEIELTTNTSSFGESVLSEQDLAQASTSREREKLVQLQTTSACSVAALDNHRGNGDQQPPAQPALSALDRQDEARPNDDDMLPECCSRNCLRSNPSDVLAARFDSMALSSAEKDMVLMGIMQTCMVSSQRTKRSKQRNAERKQVQPRHTFHGEPLCRAALLYVMAMSKNLITAVSKHYQREGLNPRTYSKRGKALTITATSLVTEFIDKYSQQHALQLPGRVPGFRRELLQLLPSYDTKSIYEKYKLSCDAASIAPVSKTSFRCIWKDARPYIAISKPMTDLCDMCQTNGAKVAR